MYFDTPEQVVSIAFATAACGYALCRGGSPERIGGAALLSNWYLAPVLARLSMPDTAHLGVFALDAVTALILVGLALRSDRYWPLFVAAFQVLELLMHAGRLADSRIHARAYFVGIEIASYLILAALAAGTWLETPRSSKSVRSDPPGVARP